MTRRPRGIKVPGIGRMYLTLDGERVTVERWLRAAMPLLVLLIVFVLLVLVVIF